MSEIPRINVGKFVGTPIDQLPASYLRWMIGQDFPIEWIKIAKEKLAGSDFYNDPINVTRHAIDMYSKRFLNRWTETCKVLGEDAPGLASFVAMAAKEAWDSGIDTSAKRFVGDGIRRDFKGVRWVFHVSPHYPDLKDVITVMNAD